MDVLHGLPNGASQPLMNQLRSVSKDRDNQCKKMDDFMHLLSVKKSNISNDDVTLITDGTTDIMGALGCDVPAPAPDVAPAQGDTAPTTINGDPLRRSS